MQSKYFDSAWQRSPAPRVPCVPASLGAVATLRERHSQSERGSPS